MKATHHKNGQINTLVDEAPYQPGYEDAAFKPKPTNDYSENYLRIQKLLKCYHNATLKCNYNVATKIAHDLAEETIKLEFATYDQIRKSWLS
jgi:hypothetical protein